MPKEPAGEPNGRPRYDPTDKERWQVEAMAAYGIPQSEIAAKLGISEPTLRKAFERELMTGSVTANTQVAEFLFATIMGRTVGDKPAIKSDQARMTGMIFWLKTRAHWKETAVLQTQELPAEGSVARDTLLAKVARLAPREPENHDPETGQ